MRTMLIRGTCLLLALLLIAAPLRAGEAFVEGFEDLPLAPGLANLSDAGTGFDKPTGRIVVAYARGETSKSSVEKFYSTTLPQLGWTAERSGAYLREGERLTIEILGADGSVTVRYTLAPI
ncbi:MAG TPA: hypothetical protein VED46_16530 [Alphaproteobacteria bacterium]|nr:hypothetical protein [Alphaproteobacteria bacterium]